MKTYDVLMAKHAEVTLDAVIDDPREVLRLVEHERATVSVMNHGEAVAVISPAPVAETLANLHHALEQTPPSDSFYLDVMETRRLLGL